MSSEKLFRINLVDVMNVLHVGEHVHSKLSIPDATGTHFKTGGMYAITNLLRRANLGGLNDMWIFCFDRHSFRKELALQLGIEYKSNRIGVDKSHLFVQADELYHWLGKMGFNVAATDGLEADDLIASYATMFKEHDHIYTNIITADRDSAFLVHEKCGLFSPNSKVSDVNMRNFATTVGKGGHLVPYNSILLYKAIVGDNSDTIPSACGEPYSVYKRVCKALTESGLPLQFLGDVKVVEEVINTYLEGEVKERALNNLSIIQPHIVPSNELPLKEQVIDFEVMGEFCSIYSMKMMAKKFGVLSETIHPNAYKHRMEINKQVALKRGTSAEDEVSSTSETEDTHSLNGVERYATIKGNKVLGENITIDNYDGASQQDDGTEINQDVISSDIHFVD